MGAGLLMPPPMGMMPPVSMGMGMPPTSMGMGMPGMMGMPMGVPMGSVPGMANPRLAKEQAEAIARMKAQYQDAQQATQQAEAEKVTNKDDDRKRAMEEIHAAAADGGKRRKKRWGDEDDKANVKAVISSDLTPDQQKAYMLHVQIEEVSVPHRVHAALHASAPSCQ